MRLFTIDIQTDDLEPIDDDFQTMPPSISTDSARSRPDRGQAQVWNKTFPKGKATDTGASSSGITHSERARSLILPSTAPSTEGPRER